MVRPASTASACYCSYFANNIINLSVYFARVPSVATVNLIPSQLVRIQASGTGENALYTLEPAEFCPAESTRVQQEPAEFCPAESTRVQQEPAEFCPAESTKAWSRMEELQAQ